MQVESGVQMHSMLKCNKTFYFNAQDGNVHVVESDALIVSSLKQDLIGERADSNGFNFQVILDKDFNVCWIYPCFNGKLCGVEQSILFIIDDWRLFWLKTLDYVTHSFVKKTGLDLWHKRLGTFPMIQHYELWATRMGWIIFPGLFQVEQIAPGISPDYIIGNFWGKEALAAQVQKTKNLIEPGFNQLNVT